MEKNIGKKWSSEPNRKQKMIMLIKPSLYVAIMLCESWDAHGQPSNKIMMLLQVAQFSFNHESETAQRS
jgi:hypothetical protein